VVARRLPASRLEASDAAVGVGGGGGGEGGSTAAAAGAAGRGGGNAGLTAAFDGALGEMPLGPLPVPPGCVVAEEEVVAA
jgi:hypothetical protein